MLIGTWNPSTSETEAERQIFLGQPGPWRSHPLSWPTFLPSETEVPISDEKKKIIYQIWNHEDLLLFSANGFSSDISFLLGLKETPILKLLKAVQISRKGSAWMSRISGGTYEASSPLPKGVLSLITTTNGCPWCLLAYQSVVGLPAPSVSQVAVGHFRIHPSLSYLLSCPKLPPAHKVPL